MSCDASILKNKSGRLAVTGRLAEDIEIAARMRLSNTLASSNNAPVNVINKLAFDDLIDVAGPPFGSPSGSTRER
jgi:hypothetical protein